MYSNIVLQSYIQQPVINILNKKSDFTKQNRKKLNACKTDNHNLIVKQLNYEHIISKQERSHTLGGWWYS